MPIEGHDVRLRSYLAARLGPLAVLLVGLVAVSAPVAFYVLGIRTLRVEADAMARQVADTIRREAEERPRLWKYDTLKLLGHLRAYEVQENVAHIEVVDDTGDPIDPSFDNHDHAEVLSDAALVWVRQPVVAHGREVGGVWVAASTVGVRKGALLLLIPFGLLGLGLGGLMYWLPLRTMAGAEDRIGALITRLEQSQAALAALNENLEQQVEDRSSKLAGAYQELQQKELRLRDLSTRAAAMQEAERRAIARELHDSAGQAMTAIRIHLQVMEQHVDDPGRVQLNKVVSMVDATLEEIRRAVRRLGPAILDDVGLAEALDRLCDDFVEQRSARLHRRFELPEGGLSPALESTCYRVVQEALTNVMRHAQADSVEVTLRTTSDQVIVEVTDDGKGFEARSGIEATSSGVMGMRERVELLGGSLEIHSTPGAGTQVRAVCPRGAETPVVPC